jgi:hypothetical protein
VRDETEIRQAVERATAHIVRALSAAPPNMKAYQAAFHLPGVESGPGQGADGIVIANLLANWAEGVCLFPQDIFPPVPASPAAGEYRAAVVAAAASGDRAGLKETLIPVINLSDQLLGEVTYALASDYTHLIRLCGGLSAVQDITGIVAGAALSSAERNIVFAASLIVSVMSAGETRYAQYAVDRFSRRPSGAHTLTLMLGVLVRAAWVTMAKASPAPELAVPDDERLRVAGLVPRGESARRAVRLVRKAVVSLPADGAEADFVLHATALANLSLPDLVVAVRYAVGLIARHVPAAVQTMVVQAADALDPDRRP